MLSCGRLRGRRLDAWQHALFAECARGAHVPEMRIVSQKACASLTRLVSYPQIARAAIGCVVIGHFPLNAHPARVGLEHIESYFFGWRHISRGFGLLQTVAFVAVTLCIALLVRLQPHKPRGSGANR